MEKPIQWPGLLSPCQVREMIWHNPIVSPFYVIVTLYCKERFKNPQFQRFDFPPQGLT